MSNTSDERNENFALALADTMTEPWVDAGVDFAESSIDSLLNNDLLKSIPVVQSCLALCKTGIRVRDKFLLKQTLNFIRCFNDGTLPEEKIIAYRERLRSDKKWAEKELEHVLVLLDSTVNVSQSTRLAKFYQAYVRGAIKWDKFCELSEANLRIFEDDVRLLEEIDKNIGMKSDYRALRLLAVGLLNESRPSVTGMTMNLDCTYYVSKFGAEFLYCLRESGEI